jgi:SAM-dependent methyltransferase
MREKLYDVPKYYDIAFSWDISREIELFRDFFKRYVPFEVKDILEPACGPGRFLVSLPKYGYCVTGYDNNPKMVAYAKKRIVDAGLQGMAKAMIGDMKSARFKIRLDAAINSINSLGYLLTDEEILAHFCNTADSLKQEGIYIVHLACAWDRLEPDKDEGWIMERDGIRVKTIWDIEKEDRQERLSYQVCKMEIDDHGKPIALEDRHILRLWFYEDLLNLIRKSGKFKLEAIYDEKRNQIPLGAYISGELGNLYYVIKVL